MGGEIGKAAIGGFGNMCQNVAAVGVRIAGGADGLDLVVDGQFDVHFVAGQPP
jgi:hypothetical protein